MIAAAASTFDSSPRSEHGLDGIVNIDKLIGDARCDEDGVVGYLG